VVNLWLKAATAAEGASKSAWEDGMAGRVMQRGRAATKHVGPNGVRPWGERRSTLDRAENVRGTTTSHELVLQRDPEFRIQAKRSEQTGNVYENKGQGQKVEESGRQRAGNEAGNLKEPNEILKEKADG
jgi:hypothetical protein